MISFSGIFSDPKLVLEPLFKKERFQNKFGMTKNVLRWLVMPI